MNSEEKVIAQNAITPEDNEWIQKQKRKMQEIAVSGYPDKSPQRVVAEYLKCFNILQAHLLAGFRYSFSKNYDAELRTSRFKKEIQSQMEALEMKVASAVAMEMKGTASLLAVEKLSKYIELKYGREKKKDNNKDDVIKGWDQ